MDLITEQRIARRQIILQTARQALTERGYEAVTVRDLAERCGVSVPTLYNQFGGKDRLLAEAIEEHFRLGSGSAPTSESVQGIDRLLALIDRYTQLLLASPAYHRRLIEAFALLNETDTVKLKMAAALTKEISDELATLMNRKELADWIVADALAAQLTSAAIGTAIQWSSHYIHDDRLRDAMRYSLGLIVLGVVRGQAQPVVQQLVKDAQSALATDKPANISTSNTGAT